MEIIPRDRAISLGTMPQAGMRTMRHEMRKEKETEVGTCLGEKKKEIREKCNIKKTFKKKTHYDFYSLAIAVLLVFINARLY